MRTILVASLFVSAALLHAQTVTKGQSAALVARNESTLLSAAPPPAATDVNSTLRPRRVSTGVIAPKLISAPALRVAVTDFPSPDLATQHAVVRFTVDEKGVPQNIRLVKSAGQAVDERVLGAVRQYRFAPATLDDQAVAMDVDLVLNFTNRQ